MMVIRMILLLFPAVLLTQPLHMPRRRANQAPHLSTLLDKQAPPGVQLTMAQSPYMPARRFALFLRQRSQGSLRSSGNKAWILHIQRDGPIRRQLKECIGLYGHEHQDHFLGSYVYTNISCEGHTYLCFTFCIYLYKRVCIHRYIYIYRGANRRDDNNLGPSCLLAPKK